jgi:uroporphyrinogen decarboxylase
MVQRAHQSQVEVIQDRSLTIPLIGFVGGPYTVASYGATSWMDAIEEATLEYMQLQIDAGVQVMQIFDSYVAQADDAIFARAMRFLERVRSRFSLPLIFYARKLGDRIVQIPSGYCVGVDETVAIDSVHRCVQGNLDPQTLIDGTHLHHAQRILDAMQGRSDFIFNIGRGVLPATPLSAVQELVAFVHSYEPAVV